LVRVVRVLVIEDPCVGGILANDDLGSSLASSLPVRRFARCKRGVEVTATPCLLVSKRAVTTARGQALADQHGIRFFETSAKNSINIEEAFSTIARDIKQRLLDGSGGAPTAGNGAIRLGDSAAASKKAGGKGCC